MKTARINYVGSHDVSNLWKICWNCDLFTLLILHILFPLIRWNTPRSAQSVPTSQWCWLALVCRARAWAGAGRTGVIIIIVPSLPPPSSSPSPLPPSGWVGTKRTNDLSLSISGYTNVLPNRGYRSTQGAGYSDGLVIHSSRPTTMQVFPLCIPQNLWCSQMSVRVSFLIFISITIITVQGWPEDRELRDSYRLSDMATATTPTMVNGTIWKVFWFKVFPDDARSPWIRFATKTWMSADQVKQRSKRHLWHALWPGRRTICGTFVQHKSGLIFSSYSFFYVSRQIVTKVP